MFSINKKSKTLKKYWKMGKKYWKSRAILSVRKSGKNVYVSLGNLSFGNHDLCEKTDVK